MEGWTDKLTSFFPLRRHCNKWFSAAVCLPFMLPNVVCANVVYANVVVSSFDVVCANEFGLDVV